MWNKYTHTRKCRLRGVQTAGGAYYRYYEWPLGAPSMQRNKSVAFIKMQQQNDDR